MFKKEEALSFVKDKLGVKEPEEKFSTQKKDLLEEILIKVQNCLPFQNLCLLSKPLEQRHRPSLEEIKRDMLSGRGGLCYNLDVAGYFLLQALGYDVTLAHATCTSSVTFPNNHIVIYVHNVSTPGDQYLVEVGVGFPTFRAVSLDFEVESPEFIDSFIEYKYMKIDGKLLRMHRKGDAIRASGIKYPKTDYYVGEWRRFYFAEMEGTTNFEDFDKDFDPVFTDPEATPFHSTLRIVSFPNKKAVIVVNGKTMIENEQGVLEVSPIEGGDEGILLKIRELFSMMPQEIVHNAIVNWRKAQKSPL